MVSRFLLFFPQDPGCSIFTCEFLNEVSLGASGLKKLMGLQFLSPSYYVQDFTSFSFQRCKFSESDLLLLDNKEVSVCSVRRVLGN